MSASFLVVGLGAVGTHTVRQLADTPGVERIVVADKRDEPVERIVATLGRQRITVADPDALPADVDAVLCALPDDDDVAVAEFAIANGLPFASATDDADAITQLLALDTAASDAGVTLAIGAGFAPGYADLLARHAAEAFDTVDEVHISRVGAAGSASAASVRRALRGKAIIAADGVLKEVRPRGHELIWFPEPMQARDCTLVASNVALLTRVFPRARRITTRIAEGSAPSWILPQRVPDDAWGAVRVEVWGRRGNTEAPLIYGCMERTAIAAGVMLAVTGLALSGVLDARGDDAPFSGAHGIAELFEPVPLIAECWHRGMKAAAFEGLEVGAPSA